MSVTRERLAALPKAELHVHLDGSLRPETMLELARECGVALPVDEPGALAEAMCAADTRSLEEYLRVFEVTLPLLQHADALERVAYELTVDAAAENVRYLEVRWSPLLNTQRGLPLTEAVEAPLRGLRRAEEETGIRTAVILCAIRGMDPATSMTVAELAVSFAGRGVVAMDLAGGEHGRPAGEHREAFETVARANMAVTVHAGEAFGPASIHQALHACRAHRIGHGTRLREDRDLMRYVKDRRIPLEVCPTSNVQTGAVPSFADHPLRLYFDEDLVVTLNTDNRLVSGITLTDEYLRAHEDLGFTWEELCRLARMGFEAAFLPWEEKKAFLAEVDEVIAGL